MNAPTGRLHVELLYLEDCPFYRRVWSDLLDVIASEGVDASVRPVKIGSAEQADAIGFAGSPTVTVDGTDLEGYRGPGVMACRIYRENGHRGWPSKALLKRGLGARGRSEPSMDLRLLTEHLMWGDARLLGRLEGLSDEEFDRAFTGAAGSIRSKTAHIISVYAFFIAVLEGRPHDRFPDLTGQPKDALLATWRSVVDTWPRFVRDTPGDALFGLPLAGGRRVEARHIFLDALLHTTHHRGQVLTFLRLLGKTTDENSPRDTDLDYLTFLLAEHPEHVHLAAVVSRRPGREEGVR